MNMERSNQVPKTGLSVCAEALPEALPICCVVLLTAAKPLCNFQLSLAQAAEVMFAGTILDTHATRTVASKMSLRWNGLVMDVAAIDIDPIHLTHLAQTADGGPRARRGRHPRDGSVPAARDPTAAVRLREEAAPAEGAVGHDSIEPEVLTPAEASARRRMKASAEVQAGSDPDLVERAAQPLAIEDGGPVAPNAADAEAIQPVLEEPVWSRFDLGTSLQLLRSSRPGVVRRALRKLHIRWYHAPARRMSPLLTAAGVPVEVVAQVADVVATCFGEGYDVGLRKFILRISLAVAV